MCVLMVSNVLSSITRCSTDSAKHLVLSRHVIIDTGTVNNERIVVSLHGGGGDEKNKALW
jgi:hypothetical protein